MSEWRDFCENLDDDQRLLAEIWQWFNDNPASIFTDNMSPDCRARAITLYNEIAKRLNIR